MQNLQLQMVSAVLLVDHDSNRILAKYYHPEHHDPKNPAPAKQPFSTLKEQRAFEAAVWEKTRKQSGQSVRTAPFTEGPALNLCSSGRPPPPPTTTRRQATFFCTTTASSFTNRPSTSLSTSSDQPARTS